MNTDELPWKCAGDSSLFELKGKERDDGKLKIVNKILTYSQPNACFCYLNAHPPGVTDRFMLDEPSVPRFGVCHANLPSHLPPESAKLQDGG